MDKDNLKSMWHDANINLHENGYEKVNIEEIANLKHSKLISKVLVNQKVKFLLYLMFFAIYIGLMFYAFVYLGLQLSVASIIPLFLAGVFIFVKTTSEISRFLVLTRTADNMSIKESVFFFRKELNKIKTIDFLFHLIFFYSCAIGILYGYLSDLGRTPLGRALFPFFLVVFLALLIIPWFIKYQHEQRYKKLYSNLRNASMFLEDEL